MDLIQALFVLALWALAWALMAWWHERKMAQASERAYMSACRRAEGEQEAAEWFRDKWESIAQQNADMAQQLATLRVDKFAVPEQRQFEKREDPEPLSPDLMDFLRQIESAEAREIVEDEVEAMKNAGLSETEILSRIERGDNA